MKATRRIAAAVTLTALMAPALAQSPPASPVAVAEVTRSNVTATVPIAGTVYSRNDLNITVGVEGRLELVAEPGTVINTGDVITRIDMTPLNLQLAEQRALGERARTQLDFLDAQLARQQNLIGTNSTSRNQLEQTQAERNVAASDLSIAGLKIQQLEDQMARGVVRAPFDGVIVERLRRAGEDVARGTIVARFIDTANLEIRVFAPLRFAGRVTAGDEVRIFGFEAEQTGIVRTVVPTADVRSQTFELRVDPAPDSEKWSIGELVSVAVPIRATESSLVVPRDALILRQDGTYVFVVDATQTAHRVRVQTGDSAGSMVAVRGELDEGDRVVIRGAETLGDGRAVVVINAAGTATGADISPAGG